MRVLAALLGSVVVVGTGGGAASTGPAPVAAPPAVVAYVAPVEVPLRVVRPYAAPVDRYGPGHRGVDLDVGSSLQVRAAAAGTVTFAGPVAGRGVLVIAHADGIRTEYEPVRPLVVRGAVVRPGQLVALVSGRHPGCDRACLHWGARRGDAYLDPLALLRPLGPVRLLPWARGP